MQTNYPKSSASEITSCITLDLDDLNSPKGKMQYQVFDQSTINPDLADSSFADNSFILSDSACKISGIQTLDEKQPFEDNSTVGEEK